MIYDKARELAKMIAESDEYKDYKSKKDIAMENETTKQLISEYHKLQYEAQANMISGKTDNDLLEKLQKIGEVLQFNKDAAEFLMSEYKINVMLGDIYKILADAVDIKLDGV